MAGGAPSGSLCTSEGFPSSQLDADQFYGHSVVGNLHSWQPTPRTSNTTPSGGIVTNRKLRDIVKDQKPLVLAESETVQEACRFMWERRTGSVLVVDDEQHLIGIFTVSRRSTYSCRRQ